MVEQQLQHVACDRCGEAWTGLITVPPPDGWIGVTVGAALPRERSDAARRQHLCPGCHEELLKFLNNWEVVRRDSN